MSKQLQTQSHNWVDEVEEKILCVRIEDRDNFTQLILSLCRMGAILVLFAVKRGEQPRTNLADPAPREIRIAPKPRHLDTSHGQDDWRAMNKWLNATR